MGIHEFCNWPTKLYDPCTSANISKVGVVLKIAENADFHQPTNQQLHASHLWKAHITLGHMGEDYEIVAAT